MVADERELVGQIARTTGLDPARAARVIADVLAAQSETVGQYVRRRHRELQSDGRNNAEIYPQLHAEIAARRFASETLSERQLRRLIYG